MEHGGGEATVTKGGGKKGKSPFPRRPSVDDGPSASVPALTSPPPPLRSSFPVSLFLSDPLNAHTPTKKKKTKVDGRTPRLPLLSRESDSLPLGNGVTGRPLHPILCVSQSSSSQTDTSSYLLVAQKPGGGLLPFR